MKIRIKDNSLRLRLTQSEVEAIHKEGEVECSIDFLDASLHYSLKRDDVREIGASFNNNHIKVVLPEVDANEWACNEQKVGLEHLQKMDDGKSLKILVEKDFACLTDRPEEDESDNFPNPLAKHNC